MPAGVRLIVCINRRPGADQRPCAGRGSPILIELIDAMIAEQDLAISVVRRECLGCCEQGPTMRIAPDGPFFTEIDDAVLAVIIDEPKLFIDSRDESGN